MALKIDGVNKFKIKMIKSLNKSALVLGGNGVLGKAMVSSFKAHKWSVLSMDFSENNEADSNLLLSSDTKIQKQLPDLYGNISSFSKEFDSIICVAGGF